jgi:recombination protein RecT
MSAKETQNPLQVIKTKLFAPGTLQLFKDNLPAASKELAEKAANRFAKMVYTTICQNPSLQKCTFASLAKAASQSASLDLDIDVRGLAYLIPYRNKNVQEAQFQIGYLGLIELAYRSRKVKSISAHCIYESEKETAEVVRVDGQYSVKHPFSYEKPTGKLVAVYATAEIDGLGPQTVVLRFDEIERYRKISKAPNSPAWKDHYEAMAKKTAIRQLAKFLPKSIVEDFSRGAAMDEHETFVEAQVSAEETIKNQAGSEPVDAEFEDDDAATKAKAEKQKAALKGKKKTAEPKPTTEPEEQAMFLED